VIVARENTTTKPTDIRRGLMLVLSSPSGAGKSTLSRSLIEKDAGIALSVSVTTRARRGNEVDGVHYYFKTMREFERMRDDDELLEWAEVHGNCYGTPRGAVEKALADGRDVLFDIDWQGTQQLKSRMDSDIVTVFVLPPSAAELKNRLERRAEDDAVVIERRLRNARVEISHWNEYDYVLINDDVNQTFGVLRQILSAERTKRVRQLSLQKTVARLDDELGKIVS
jgi:guanylate kinase